MTEQLKAAALREAEHLECQDDYYKPNAMATSASKMIHALVDEIDALRAALAALAVPTELGVLVLGQTYWTQEGKLVTMVHCHNYGADHETMVCKDGVHRYSRRLGDIGRVTGTAHDYSCPLNIARPLAAAPQPAKEVE